MGKPLSLGNQVKYPITISKLLKNPEDPVKKQESILQYSFTWWKEVGDPLRDEVWKEKQTTIADWDSPVDGKISKWLVKEGAIIERNSRFVEVVEECPHSIQFQGLCGMCGKDMTEMSWASASNDTERAKISMIHDQTALRVSQDEASKAEEELQRRLLKAKKLSLVVDLDQTIIHACIEPTVGEWQNDKNSPNYEAVKDVKSFQLNDDGPRGIASGCNYYIKMRPGLKEFLDKVSEMYELHVYTMGTRAYAREIAKIVDPGRKLFGDRIISRDENGNMTAKNLARLFPVDTKMVVIIDDRADVWPNNRLNLIKVLPYDFFLGIGDINSSFLPKREDLPPKPTDSLHKNPKTMDAERLSGEASVNRTAGETKELSTPGESGKGSALDDLVRMGGGDDQALREEQAAEQERLLKAQLDDRPLLHMQEKLEKEEEQEDNATEEKNGVLTADHPHHKHNLLKDDDVELMYLERHLTNVHKVFYNEYESGLRNAQGGRVAQLKPGHNKKVSIKGDDSADLKLVPDIAVIMPRIKQQTLAGCVIVMSGLVPIGVDLLRSETAMQAMNFGAELHSKVSRKVTHLVASSSRTRTTKVRQAAQRPHIKIVTQDWLFKSMSKWEKEDETEYLVPVSESDRKRGQAFSPSSVRTTDGEEDDSGSGEGDEDNDVVPSSQDELIDEENLLPSTNYEGTGQVNWGAADDELAEFLDDDSDTGSDTSSNIRDKSGNKRKYDETEDEDDSDAESTLSKKQRLANSRTTGLKTSKTTNIEQSLPTPGPTSDGLDDDTKASDDDDFDDLEAELEAALDEEVANDLADSGGSR